MDTALGFYANAASGTISIISRILMLSCIAPPVPCTLCDGKWRKGGRDDCLQACGLIEGLLAGVGHVMARGLWHRSPAPSLTFS